MTTVLIVDDDEDMRQLLVATMHQAGYRVLAATDGFEALSIARDKHPELIVTDVYMPGCDGWKLAVQLRTDPATAAIPIIFVSRLAGRYERIRSFRTGADDFIPKPFTPEELIRRMERALLVAEAERARRSEPTLQGRLERIGLPSILMMLEYERKSGTLIVESGDASCVIVVAEGQLISAELSSKPRAQLHDCIFSVFDWVTGSFRFDAGNQVAPTGPTTPIHSILLEAARRSDEQLAASGDGPN